MFFILALVVGIAYFAIASVENSWAKSVAIKKTSNNPANPPFYLRQSPNSTDSPTAAA